MLHVSSFTLTRARTRLQHAIFMIVAPSPSRVGASLSRTSADVVLTALIVGGIVSPMLIRAEQTPVPIGRLSPWPRTIPLHSRVMAFAGAMANLIWLDVCGLAGFRSTQAAVKRVGVATTPSSYDALALVRVAVRDACVFYVKPVHCLQRSAAVTRMLRRRGIQARLIIGCRPAPVASHAWVEVDGKVVWDYMDGLSHFVVIDRL